MKKKTSKKINNRRSKGSPEKPSVLKAKTIHANPTDKKTTKASLAEAKVSKAKAKRSKSVPAPKKLTKPLLTSSKIPKAKTNAVVLARKKSNSIKAKVESVDKNKFLIENPAHAASVSVTAEAVPILENTMPELKVAEGETFSQTSQVSIRIETCTESIPMVQFGSHERKMFRILCLDGGGIRGAFTASIINHYQKSLQHYFADYFDLIVGTSTGGIIALGLAAGMKTDSIVKFYKERGPKIFPEKNWVSRFSSWFRPSYDSNKLEENLVDIFKSNTNQNLLLKDLRRRVIVTAFDATRGRPRVFKSPYLNRLKLYHGARLVDLAMATSAAPTYFRTSETELGLMIDGGVWANCPIMIGIVEAIREFKMQVDEIAVLSIGAINKTFVMKNGKHSKGIIHWAAEAPDLLMQASKLGDIEQAMRLCKYFYRVDNDDPENRFSMSDSTKVKELVQIGSAVAEESFSRIEPELFSFPAQAPKML